MISPILKMLKFKRGDISITQLIAFIIALILLAVLIYISVKSGNDMGSVGEELDSLLS